MRSIRTRLLELAAILTLGLPAPAHADMVGPCPPGFDASHAGCDPDATVLVPSCLGLGLCLAAGLGILAGLLIWSRRQKDAPPPG